MTPDLKQLFRTRGLRLSEIANRLGVNKATVTRWTRYRIPAERVAEVAEATGVSKAELRPDLFADPQLEAAAQ